MIIAHPAKRSTTYFNCPNCSALYHLIKAKAGVETIDREIKCLSCNARLPSREGDLVLKYFLLKKPTLPDLRARKEVSERPPTPSLAPCGDAQHRQHVNNTSQLRQAECPNCTARLWFRQALVPKLDTQGFESYELNCEYCGAVLAGVIDPRDGALLLSTQASSELSDWTTAA